MASRMGILGLGVSFRRAPAELLDRLAFADEDLTKVFAHARDLDGLDEVVVLSTCNRVEVYGNVANYHAGFLALKRLVLETRGVAPEELAEPLYSLWERDAADHLFAVAAGLDSLVLGETQIQGQVRDAFRRAEREGGAGPVLTALFQAAAHAGRRVRHETALGAAPDAYAALAAELAAATLDGLDGRSVVVVGAGRMAALAVTHLRDLGARPITIMNRTSKHARALAERTGSTHADITSLPGAIARADLVVSATGSAGYVVRRSDIGPRRNGRPLVVVDLAVPRDVEPSCATVSGVRVIDIATVREHVGAHTPETAEQITLAHELVAEEVRRWTARRRGDELAPLITAIRARGDDVVRAELERWSSRLARLSPEEREAVEALARGVAAKLLHDPIVALKEHGEPGTDRAHARLLAEMLGIDLSDER
jgi:glutamyl-tRNA reductase